MGSGNTRPSAKRWQRQRIKSPREKHTRNCVPTDATGVEPGISQRTQAKRERIRDSRSGAFPANQNVPKFLSRGFVPELASLQELPADEGFDCDQAATGQP